MPTATPVFSNPTGSDMPAKKKPWYAAGLRFECTGCGRCCINHGDEDAFVYLTKAEVKAMADHLAQDIETFKTTYCTTDDGDLILKDNGDRCIFLEADTNRCGVYEARPRQCKTWPFWSENLAHAEWNGSVKDLCPGIDQGRLYTRKEIEDLAAWTDALWEEEEA